MMSRKKSGPAQMSTAQISVEPSNRLQTQAMSRACMRGSRKLLALASEKQSGEVITDKAKQLDRWVEHYSKLYSMENVVHQSALDAIDHLPLMPELDEAPSINELSKAIDRLPLGKAPGKDGILAEVIKNSKSTLLVPLHKLLTQCWKEGSVPQDMKDSNIITLYKNKGNCSDCNNYHGISLLSVIDKMFCMHHFTQTVDSC